MSLCHGKYSCVRLESAFQHRINLTRGEIRPTEATHTHPLQHEQMTLWKTEFLKAGGVKKKGQKHEALTWVFGSSDRIRTGDLRLERAAS